MAKRKLKKNLGKKIISGIFYVAGVLLICAGVIGIISFDDKKMISNENKNANLNKYVSTKELVATFRELDKKNIKCDYWDYLQSKIDNYNGLFCKSYDWALDYSTELDEIKEIRKQNKSSFK